MFEDHHLLLNYNMNLPAMAYLVNAPDNHASKNKYRPVILCVQYARTSTQIDLLQISLPEK